MAEDIDFGSLVVPGTFIRVRAEGLISAGGISTGNIGIVGTAAKGYGTTEILTDFRSAVNAFGPYDSFETKKHNLVRALELLFANGARTIYARALAPTDAEGVEETETFTAQNINAQFAELVKDDVNILVLPESGAADASTILRALVENNETHGKDMMAIVGTDQSTVANITGQVTVNDRLVFCAPGLIVKEPRTNQAGKVDMVEVSLPGTYTAAAVAGLLSSLSVATSPTNKGLPGVTKLGQTFNYGELTALINGGVLVLENRGGVRIVRGVTTEQKDGLPFRQISTRRIVDFAKAGVRKVGNTFLGRLNNVRVRKALQGAIQGFLDTMVQGEALTGYDLEVTATRADEIANRAIVNLRLRPTFSIDFSTKVEASI